MPDEATDRMGLAARFQPLKVPITDTRRALGAQTANWVPATPSRSVTWAPSFS